VFKNQHKSMERTEGTSQVRKHLRYGGGGGSINKTSEAAQGGKTEEGKTKEQEVAPKNADKRKEDGGEARNGRSREPGRQQKKGNTGVLLRKDGRGSRLKN